MYVDFDTLKDNSRVWVYQSNREFSADEMKTISVTMKNFINEWTRHGDDLKGSFDIKYNHFIILAVDESFNQVSGCSIDASTHVFKHFEKEFELELLNKLNTAFKHGDHINVVSLAEFQNYVKEKKIHPDTLVFNNLVQNKADLKEMWEVPANKSWHSRYFN
ncbi:ABC transporter ATPase [Lutimonas vermicola]|uniref:ABC transporter ATPase n=1 Tax=Lutimonas vermicola TaxID=414288 RepID=A0ABU9L3F8_9FLAO